MHLNTERVNETRGNKFLSLNGILRMKSTHPTNYFVLRSENAIQREEFIPSLLAATRFLLLCNHLFPIRPVIPFFNRLPGVTCAFTAGLL